MFSGLLQDQKISCSLIIMQQMKKKREFDHLKAQKNSELSGPQSKDLKSL